MHSSSSREEIAEVFDALEADMRRALELSCDVLTTPECLAMLERCETLRRRLPVIEHPLINKIAEQSDPTELGGKLPFALAERLGITRAEASRRIAQAADDLTQGCGPHHKLITSGGWITRKRADGATEWIPPAHLDHGQTRTNIYHHPEKLLRPDDDPARRRRPAVAAVAPVQACATTKTNRCGPSPGLDTLASRRS